jgi:phenylalanyl-tRNA synthetase beta chain
MSVMRTSLWPGLIQAASYNQNRQQPRIRLFETGLVFEQHNDAIVQENRIAGIALGDVISEQWGEGSRAIDFYDVKADVEALLGLGDMMDYHFEAETCEALHPGQSARIHVGGKPVGWLGILHPSVTQAVELTGNTVIFELRLDAILQANVAKFAEISKFPSIRRDLAIIVDEQITAQSVQECIEKSAGELLNNVVLFDMYQGKGIDSGRKSLALGLTLGDSSRTLMEEDVEAVLGKVVTALNNKLGATLRD